MNKYKIGTYYITCGSNFEIPVIHKRQEKGRIYKIDDIKIGIVKRDKLYITHIDSGLLLPLKTYYKFSEFENDIEEIKEILYNMQIDLVKATEKFKDVIVWKGARIYNEL